MFPENAEAVWDQTALRYEDYHNPGLAKLLKFGGLGVEWRSEGSFIYDAEGKEYIDFLGGYGVFGLGHRHPKVIEAVKKQLDQMPMSSKLFFNPLLAEVCERLAQICPGELQYSFLCNSGAEAIEGALKLARKATGRKQFISTIGGYHGKTMGALSATGREKYQKSFQPLLDGFVFVPYNDIEAMSRVINDQTAAVIIETIQGEGGIIVPDDDYLPALRKLCDQHGALLIADEVQTGLGRTGKMFGVEHHNVVPDIMTLAKSLGGGIVPCGSFTATPEIWEAVFGENPLIHTSTFGGNQLACAAALAAIQVIEEEGLVEQSRIKGEKLLSGLRETQTQYRDLLVDVRGKGLMVGVEFSQDEIGELVISGMVRNGVIAAYTLNNPRVIRLEPPLIVTETQIDTAINVFAESLAETMEFLKMVV